MISRVVAEIIGRNIETVNLTAGVGQAIIETVPEPILTTVADTLYQRANLGERYEALHDTAEAAYTAAITDMMEDIATAAVVGLAGARFNAGKIFARLGNHSEGVHRLQCLALAVAAFGRYPMSSNFVEVPQIVPAVAELSKEDKGVWTEVRGLVTIVKHHGIEAAPLVGRNKDGSLGLSPAYCKALVNKLTFNK